MRPIFGAFEARVQREPPAPSMRRRRRCRGTSARQPSTTSPLAPSALPPSDGRWVTLGTSACSRGSRSLATRPPSACRPPPCSAGTHACGRHEPMPRARAGLLSERRRRTAVDARAVVGIVTESGLPLRRSRAARDSARSAFTTPAGSCTDRRARGLDAAERRRGPPFIATHWIDGPRRRDGAVVIVRAVFDRGPFGGRVFVLFFNRSDGARVACCFPP
jgi:hypothetical protein